MCQTIIMIMIIDICILIDISTKVKRKFKSNAHETWRVILMIKPVYKCPELWYYFLSETRRKREYICRPHYREIPGRIPRLRGICTEQIEDGFGEAWLNMLGHDRTACYSGRV